MKTALITGATSGIGHACSIALAHAGYRIIATGRRLERLEALCNLIDQSTGSLVYPLAFDVRDALAVKNAIENLPAEWRSIDLLINNAGLASGKDLIQDGHKERWEHMIDTNIKGLLYVTHQVLPLMDSGEKQIVNIGSIAGTEVYAGGNVYCATKHAVNALSKAMQIDLLPLGFRVIQIRPGLVETEFSVVRFDGDAKKAAKVYEGIEPLTGDDIADVVVFAVTCPKNVCLSDVQVTARAQANSTMVNRDYENNQ